VNGAVFRQALQQARRTVVILSASAGAFHFLVLLASSSFLKSTANIPFLKNPPKAFSAFLGGSADFFHPSGWVAAGMTHPVTLALMTGSAMTVAAGAVAVEIERGTIDLVLVRPVRRESFLLAKAAASVVSVTLAEAGGFIGVLVARATIGSMRDLAVSKVTVAFANSWALFVALAMVAVLISAATSLRSRATGVAVGFVVGAFFINFIALLIDGVSAMRYASPFHYFRPGDVLTGSGAGGDVAVLAALAVVALVAALQVFGSRDLTH
jgi:ABC-2 type transport system permease protein